jgi:hypothetical protein
MFDRLDPVVTVQQVRTQLPLNCVHQGGVSVSWRFNPPALA